MISIIIPCYNTAQYIDKCLESILSQNYQDYEIIIINDGSTDNLLAVLDKYKENPKIKIFSYQNQGVAQARNEGISKASGEYIMFVDPDDYITPNALQILYEETQKDQYDAIRYGFRKIYVDQNNIGYDDKEEPKIFNNNEEIINDYLPTYIGIGQDDFDNWKAIGNNIWKYKQFASVCRFLFRRDTIIKNNIQFKRGITLGEDKFFICLFFLYANKICITNHVLYHYLIRDKGGMSSAVVNPKKIAKDKIIGIQERSNLRKLYSEKKNKDIYPMYIGTCIFGILEIIFRSKNLGFKECKTLVWPYLQLPDVVEAYQFINISGLPWKLKIPIFLIKKKLYSILIVLTCFTYKIGINIKA